MAVDKNRKRQELDPLVATIQTPQDIEKQINMTAYQRRKRGRDAQRIKGTYDLPQWIKSQIDDLAEQHSVPPSHLVSLLLAHALHSDLDIVEFRVPSRHPGFDYGLQIPDMLE